MVKITIDGKKIEIDNDFTIIQAASQNGIYIPHFCWHPSLSVSGNCRICLVEVENNPKLVIACATKVSDGMVIRTNSERVVNARQAVMEFLLINHPLDCPICDEAGECKLQEYAYRYCEGGSRFDFEKVRKPKRVYIGQNVVLDVERCIMCSRCIRFCNEIVKKPQLVFTQRGDQVVLTTFPGEQLDNPYSLNTVDICPVGALTSRHFRFKARVWEMSSTNTICIGCARGCNIKIWVRNNEILRITPRFNPKVNSYWLCDYGRLNTFKFVNAENRIKAPKVRKGGVLVEVSWDEAIATAVSRLKSFKKNEIAGLASAFATNEDNFLFVKLMRFLNVGCIDMLTHIKPESEDDILICADKSPNQRGAREVGVKPLHTKDHLDEILQGIKKGTIKALYCLEDDASTFPAISEFLPKLDLLIVHASNENIMTAQADVVFSSSTYAEKHGTYTNLDGYVQRIFPAVTTAEQDRVLDGLSLSRLDKFGAPNDKWMKGPKYDTRPTWSILTNVAKALGAKWSYKTAEDVFKEISSTIESFKGMTYDKIGYQGMQLSKLEKAKKTSKVN